MNRQAVTKVYKELHGFASTIVAKGQEHIPILIVVIDDRPMDVLPLVNVAKEMVPVMQNEAAKRPGVYTVLIVESWFVARKNPDLDNLPSPSQSPDRREALMFSFVGKDWRALAMCLIDREKKTVKRDLLHFEGDPGFGILGGALFPDRADQGNRQ